jgi:hypothetical protein
MKPQPRSSVLLAFLAIVPHHSLFAEVLGKTKGIAGTAVHYKPERPSTTK